MRLESLRWQSQDQCVAVFVAEDGSSVTSVFSLVRHSAGISANVDPDVFGGLSWDAKRIGATVQAVIAFCLAAQGESRSP